MPGSLEPSGRSPVRFIGETSHSQPVSVDVRVTYTPGRGWEARLTGGGYAESGLFGRAATPGLAVGSLIEVAAHLIWREN